MHKRMSVLGMFHEGRRGAARAHGLLAWIGRPVKMPALAGGAVRAYSGAIMSSEATITKLKPAQELFLFLIVDQGFSATKAYTTAFPKSQLRSAEASASRLLRNAKVQTRKKEMEVAKSLVVRAATRVTAGFITEKLQRVYDAAMESKQLAAASAAMMGIAKLHGLLVEKHQVDAIIRRPSLNSSGPDVLTELQWLQEFGPIVEHTPELQDQSEVVLSESTTGEGTTYEGADEDYSPTT
jgi:phage terminase small subunit